MSQAPQTPDHDAAVRAWADHLADGGTTPWRAWRTGQFHRPGGETAAWNDPDPAQTPVSVDKSDRRDLPGAAQLEAVRRLAERRSAMLDAARFRTLATRVLATPGPGRGLPHLPVLAVDPESGEPQAPTSSIGARPVDPARVPTEELLRVLTGVLPDLLIQAAPRVRTPQSPQPTRRISRPLHFRVVGPPAASAAVRAALLAAGHREGGHDERVIVVGLPVEAMLAEAWGVRVSRGSATRWHRFLSQWTGDQLLVSVNLPALARHHLVGPKRGVRARIAGAFARTTAAAPVVVLAPSVEELLPLVAEALELPDLPAAPAAPDGLDAEAADLLRRVHRIAGISLSPEQCDTATAAGTGLLNRPGDRPRIAAPSGFRSRIEAIAADLAAELHADAAGGRYAVVGDPALLASRPAHRSAAPDLGVVLERGLDLVLAASTVVPEEAS